MKLGAKTWWGASNECGWFIQKLFFILCVAVKFPFGISFVMYIHSHMLCEVRAIPWQTGADNKEPTMVSCRNQSNQIELRRSRRSPACSFRWKSYLRVVQDDRFPSGKIQLPLPLIQSDRNLVGLLWRKKRHDMGCESRRFQINTMKGKFFEWIHS